MYLDRSDLNRKYSWVISFYSKTNQMHQCLIFILLYLILFFIKNYYYYY